MEPVVSLVQRLTGLTGPVAAGLGAALGLVVFAPQSWLARMGITGLTEEQRLAVGLAFLVCVGLAVAHAAHALLHASTRSLSQWLRLVYRVRQLKNRRIRILQLLTDEERRELQEFIWHGRAIGTSDNETVHLALVRKGLMQQHGYQRLTSNINCYYWLIPGWVREYYENRPEALLRAKDDPAQFIFGKRGLLLCSPDFKRGNYATQRVQQHGDNPEQPAEGSRIDGQ